MQFPLFKGGKGDLKTKKPRIAPWFFGFRILLPEKQDYKLIFYDQNSTRNIEFRSILNWVCYCYLGNGLC